MKKLLSQFLLTLFVMPVLGIALVGPVSAAGPESSDYWGGEEVETNIQDDIMLGERDPREIAAQVINIMLGFLGIVAVIIVLAGGFKWMIAGGNQEKTDEAKKLMSAGVIGLIIVSAAFGIARFIVDSLVTATSSSS